MENREIQSDQLVPSCARPGTRQHGRDPGLGRQRPGAAGRAPGTTAHDPRTAALLGWDG